ncbi:hypothetical protein SDC9_194220 [bioreactor metagenome]|uniref:Uncharacterized protein n=1 Tax=bioreactor metagenome TaxID=1076179 RepID=A0A645I8A8_9ZZZZ
MLSDDVRREANCHADVSSPVSMEHVSDVRVDQNHVILFQNVILTADRESGPPAKQGRQLDFRMPVEEISVHFVDIVGAQRYRTVSGRVSERKIIRVHSMPPWRAFENPDRIFPVTEKVYILRKADGTAFSAKVRIFAGKIFRSVFR